MIAVLFCVFCLCPIKSFKDWYYSLHLSPIVKQHEEILEITRSHAPLFIYIDKTFINWASLIHSMSMHKLNTVFSCDLIVAAPNEHLNTFKPQGKTVPAVWGKMSECGGHMVFLHPDSIEWSCILYLFSIQCPLPFTKHSQVHWVDPTTQQTGPQSLCPH